MGFCRALKNSDLKRINPYCVLMPSNRIREMNIIHKVGLWRLGTSALVVFALQKCSPMKNEHQQKCSGDARNQSLEDVGGRMERYRRQDLFHHI
jgi:hypothetical protein